MLFRSLVNTASSNFYLTGVKLEGGSIATPWQFESLAKRLSDCQRYYQTISSWLIGGYSIASGVIYSDTALMTAMRVAPTVAIVSPAYSNASAMTLNNSFADSVAVRITVTAAGTCWGQATLTMTAEL